MNDFQRHCQSLIDDVLGDFDLAPHHQVLDLRHEKDDAEQQDKNVFLRSQFAHGGRLFDLYAYRDEASAAVENNWYLFEQRHFEGEDELARSFADFVRRCLAGEEPVEAYRSARGGLGKAGS